MTADAADLRAPVLYCLKTVFERFGVHSRGQLVAAISGGHYLPLVKGPSAPD